MRVGSGGGRRRGLVGAGLLAVVLVGALAARVPYLALVPRFTDESLEVLWSLPIARGQTFPLTNYDAYYGALFNYLVAASFVLLGPSALAARLVVLLAALLTVLATYGLGRAWGGSAAGLLAAALLATSGAHIVINSHIAWANCTTPLFTTAAVLALYLAVEPGRLGAEPVKQDRDDESGLGCPRSQGATGTTTRQGVLLALSGLLWGLALQTHVLVATFFPAVAVYVVWKGRPLLASRWAFVAMGAFLLGYGNVIVHNLTSGWESLTAAQRIRRDYAADQNAATSYPAALLAALLLAGRILGGAIDARGSAASYALDGAVLLASGLGLLALVRAARRGNPLPALLAVSCLLLLPAVNPKFLTLVTSRYLMPLLPVLLAAIASLLTAAWVAERRWRRLGAALAAVLLLLAPLQPLARYYGRAFETDDTNQRAYELAGLIGQLRGGGEPVVFDESFGSESGGVSELRAVRYLLAFDETPVRVIKITPKRLEDELDTATSLLVVLTARDLRDLDRLPLQALTGQPRRGGEAGLFRLAARPAPPPQAQEPPRWPVASGQG